MVISEPEAAAIYTARYKREIEQEDFLEVWLQSVYLTLINFQQDLDYFVLCDAGGGTVVCRIWLLSFYFLL
jgi:hypothetical protein